MKQLFAILMMSVLSGCDGDSSNPSSGESTRIEEGDKFTMTT